MCFLFTVILMCKYLVCIFIIMNCFEIVSKWKKIKKTIFFYNLKQIYSVSEYIFCCQLLN